MAGRPSKYTQELADKICEIISTSNRSMRNICAELNINVISILRWLEEKPEFCAQYTRAKELQADHLADELLEIADDMLNDTITINKNGKMVDVENTEWVNRSKLRIETRKWIASKLKPKKYGDKQEVTNIIVEQPLFPDVPTDNSGQ